MVFFVPPFTGGNRSRVTASRNGCLWIWIRRNSHQDHFRSTALSFQKSAEYQPDPVRVFYRVNQSSSICWNGLSKLFLADSNHPAGRRFQPKKLLHCFDWGSYFFTCICFHKDFTFSWFVSLNDVIPYFCAASCGYVYRCGYWTVIKVVGFHVPTSKNQSYSLSRWDAQTLFIQWGSKLFLLINPAVCCQDKHRKYTKHLLCYF